MDDRALMIVLRLLHVVGGVLWVGGVMVATFFVLPSVRALGPGGGPFMQELVQRRRFSVYLATLAVITVLSGVAMYWHLSAVTSGAYARTASGEAFGLGGLFAIVGAAIGTSVIAPTVSRMGRLGEDARAARRPPTAEEAALLTRLQGRVAKASIAVVVLLLAAAIAMAVARYV